VPDVHVVTDLVPFLAGIASGFIVQFLIQVYIVPRTESRKRRDERWEKDVIDLGDLLTGPVTSAARQARADQTLLRAMRDFPAGTLAPEETRERRQRAIWEQSQKARDATNAFTELVHSRVDWVTQKVAGFVPDSAAVVPFFGASAIYSLHLWKLAAHETEGLNAAALEDLWKADADRRLKLIGEVRDLAALRHAPRKSRRWQLWRLRKRISAAGARAALQARHRFGPDGGEPDQEPSVPAAGDSEASG
jgi:hypothetical protein